MPPRSKASQSLGIETTLWDAAKKMRGNMDAGEYKHVALGLIFLKYVSDAFAERHRTLEASLADPDSLDYMPDEADRALILESRDEYLSEGVFWVPQEARWDGEDGIQASAKQPTIGTRVDAAMDAIERENASLKGVLPKNYSRAELDPRRLGELVDLIGSIGLKGGDDSEDLLGRVYEYFLSQFADAEGKQGGEHYTPRSVVQLLTEILEPYAGRVYDPCCGSGGMFVQADTFVLAHGGKRNAISVYGQESNATTWRIAKMNLALRGIEANLGPEWGDTFHEDKHPDLRADFVLANPPFNVDDWGVERLTQDPRWQYGVPPSTNANFGWLQHIVGKLTPEGTAGVVLAVGSMTAESNGEGLIRERMVEGDLVECMVALPAQLFYRTGIQCCLWFITKDKGAKGGKRARNGETLFIDARALGTKVSSTMRVFTTDDLDKIAGTYRQWARVTGDEQFANEPGFAVSATTEDIKRNRYLLTPGLYVREHDVDEESLDAEQALIEAQEGFATATDAVAAAIAETNELVLRLPEVSHICVSKPLPKIARFVNGGAFTKGATGSGRMVIRIAELNGGPGPSTVYTEREVDEDKTAYPGDILFAWSGSLGIYRWTGPEAIINQHIFKVVPEPGIPDWFVYHHLLRALPKFKAIAADKATTMGHIRRGDLDDVQVAVPPLDYLESVDKALRTFWPLTDNLTMAVQATEALRRATLSALLPESE